MTDTPRPSSPIGSPPVGDLGLGGASEPDWITVVDPRSATPAQARLRPRRLFAQLAAGLVVVLVVVGFLGSLAAQRLAEREAVNDAAGIADGYAQTLIQPALSRQLVAGDPDAIRSLDRLVRQRILGSDVVLVKLWTPQGEVLYANEPALISRRFTLDEEQRKALTTPETVAEVSDLDNQENALDPGDRLVEVYRPVWAADGQELLFEIYVTYEPVRARSAQLRSGFSGVMISSLLLLVLLMAPVLWRLVGRVLAAQRQREQLLEHAVEASDAERRRIAAGLHDGPVQELVATSYAVAGAARRAESAGDPRLAAELSGLADTVRGNIRVLRSLLVDIYPPSLETAGLGAALGDLAQGGAGSRLQVSLEVGEADLLGLGLDQRRLVFRVAQECLRNAEKHAAPTRVLLRLRAEGPMAVLEVIDEGPGFDPGLLEGPETDHFGLRVLADLVRHAGAGLYLSTAPASGTRWRLTLIPDPTPRPGARA